MFRATAVEPASDVMVPSDGLVPISILQLDLDPPSSGGWGAFLAGRGVPVVEDDLGRPAIAREDARRLFVERREAEVRAREVAERNDAELEGRRLAQLRPGIPAHLIPPDVSAGDAMAQLARGERPRRRTLAEDLLAPDRPSVVVHSLSELAEDWS